MSTSLLQNNKSFLICRKLFAGKDLRYRPRPRRPNPLRGQDLGQQTTLTHEQVKFLQRDPLDVRDLAGVENLAVWRDDLRPLVTIWIGGVEYNANGCSQFYVLSFHANISLKKWL